MRVADQNTVNIEYLGLMWSLQYYSQMDNIFYLTRNDYGLSLQTNCKYYCHSRFQKCTILTPRIAIRRDQKNIFLIPLLWISEYLKDYKYSHFSPKCASNLLTYTRNYPVITQLLPDYPVKPNYFPITQENPLIPELPTIT